MVRDHWTFILYWWYIIYCCEKHIPISRSLDKACHVKKIKDPSHVRPIKWSRFVWKMVDWKWVVDKFRKATDQVVVRVKWSESSSAQGTQSSEKDLGVC